MKIKRIFNEDDNINDKDFKNINNNICDNITGT